GTAVAVLGSGFALGTGVQGLREAIDLRPGVVEVVLGADPRAGGAQEAGEGVTHCGPPDPTDVYGPGRVRRDELQVDPLPGQCFRMSVIRTGEHDVAGQ